MFTRCVFKVVKEICFTFEKSRAKEQKLSSVHNFPLDMCASSVLRSTATWIVVFLKETRWCLSTGLEDMTDMIWYVSLSHAAIWCHMKAGVPSEAHGCSEDFSGQWRPALSWADFPSSMSSMSCLRRGFTCIICTFPTSPNSPLNCGIMKWICQCMRLIIRTFSKPICKRNHSF